MEPRSAYVHVPFCAHHCGYCNFTVVAGRGDLIDEFLQAVERELALLSKVHEVDTLYFGGGTPTQLSGEQFRRLFRSVAERCRPAGDGEITVEANPADVSIEKLRMLAALGVNRISLGAQSFRDEHLKLLERDHRGEDIAQSVQMARDCGIDSVAIDLIFAVPGQTLDDWRRDLDAALAVGPNHVSTYGLTFERGTTFYGRLQSGNLIESPDEMQREMYEAAIETLASAGFEHYEISNFALPGRHSRHNEVYWTGRPYLAFGPGAARFINGRRETNHRSVTKYLQRIANGQSPVAESETLAPEDAARERLVFGLRRLEGVSLAEFQRETGFEITKLVGPAMERFVAMGLLEIHDGRLRLTRDGLLVSDSIWPEFL